MDPDVVQECVSDVVESLDAPSRVRTRTRSRRLHVAILCARGADGQQHASAVLRIASRVALPEGVVTLERRSMRDRELDFEPCFCAEQTQSHTHSPRESDLPFEIHQHKRAPRGHHDC